LERNLIQAGLLIRRTRWLCLLADADVAFCEQNSAHARLLVISRGEIMERGDLAGVMAVSGLPVRRPSSLRERQTSFGAASYDRMRVLLTELRRIQDEGGQIVLRIGAHALAGKELVKWMRAV
jgi:hypothetical protein